MEASLGKTRQARNPSPYLEAVFEKQGSVSDWYGILVGGTAVTTNSTTANWLKEWKEDFHESTKQEPKSLNCERGTSPHGGGGARARTRISRTCASVRALARTCTHVHRTRVHSHARALACIARACTRVRMHHTRVHSHAQALAYIACACTCTHAHSCTHMHRRCVHSHASHAVCSCLHRRHVHSRTHARACIAHACTHKRVHSHESHTRALACACIPGLCTRIHRRRVHSHAHALACIARACPRMHASQALALACAHFSHVCARARARVRACVRACVCSVFMCACVCVFRVYVCVCSVCVCARAYVPRVDVFLCLMHAWVCVCHACVRACVLECRADGPNTAGYRIILAESGTLRSPSVARPKHWAIMRTRRKQHVPTTAAHSSSGGSPTLDCAWYENGQKCDNRCHTAVEMLVSACSHSRMACACMRERARSHMYVFFSYMCVRPGRCQPQDASRGFHLCPSRHEQH